MPIPEQFGKLIPVFSTLLFNLHEESKMDDSQVRRNMVYMAIGLVVFCVSAIMLARSLVY